MKILDICYLYTSRSAIIKIIIKILKSNMRVFEIAKFTCVKQNASNFM